MITYLVNTSGAQWAVANRWTWFVNFFVPFIFLFYVTLSKKPLLCLNFYFFYKCQGQLFCWTVLCDSSIWALDHCALGIFCYLFSTAINNRIYSSRKRTMLRWMMRESHKMDKLSCKLLFRHWEKSCKIFFKKQSLILV